MIFLTVEGGLPGRIVDLTIFEGSGQGFGVGDLQYGESFCIEDAEHFFHGPDVFGNVFEDVIGDENVEGVIFEWEIGRIGV